MIAGTTLEIVLEGLLEVAVLDNVDVTLRSTRLDNAAVKLTCEVVLVINVALDTLADEALVLSGRGVLVEFSRTAVAPIHVEDDRVVPLLLVALGDNVPKLGRVVVLFAGEDPAV